MLLKELLVTLKMTKAFAFNPGHTKKFLDYLQVLKRSFLSDFYYYQTNRHPTFPKHTKENNLTMYLLHCL